MSLSKQVSSVLCAVSLCVFATNSFGGNRDQITNTPSSQLQWETTKEGVGFAALQGDRFAGAYMAMVKLPAGLVSPAHIKSADMHGMVVSGTITNIAMGADPTSEVELATGSYYKIPAGLPHISKCVSKVDCITFLYQDGKFDFLPVGQ